MKKATCGPDEKMMAWWQLSLVGVGCIIGTGFFLASGIAIRLTGSSVLLVFIVAAIGTYVVGEALGKLAAHDPQKGSFRTYAKKAFGRWAGFGSGWVYWSSEILIVGSQLTALSIFTRFWFPNIPIWIFASIYAVLGIIVVLLGASGFEKAENIFAITKVSAILMFILLALAGIIGWIHGGGEKLYIPNNTNEFFKAGLIGFWSALIFGFYAFGGIEIMGMMTPRLRKKDDARKANSVMLLMLTSIYLVSVGLAVLLAANNRFTPDESPFVVAMDRYGLAFFPHVFNGAIIVAGFSTMTASLFAVTNMLVTLSEDGDAPKIFSRKGKLKVPPFALFLTICGLIASIVTGLLMPDTVYEYITTAAGLMLLYNWIFVLFAYPRILELTTWEKVKQWIGFLLILLAVSGTLWEKASRPGFFISLIFIAVIGLVLLIMQHRWKKEDKNKEPKSPHMWEHLEFAKK
ncbi:amino acid permease [Bacillus tuaregi]|uniref:amino acid permease n=1 Tax=Bacillus tuaregi TaxID=1816695 RepID=UPI0008F8CCD2|nr:amino acid permease [Bacillus tuaregi]